MDDLKSIKDKVLADCHSDKAFWATNGIVCRNLYELVSNISGMNDFTFNYHVNKDNKKNDFANWILHILGDEILAERLYAIRNKDLYADVIKERIKELESA
jgi:hypothetical protein